MTLISTGPRRVTTKTLGARKHVMRTAGDLYIVDNKRVYFPSTSSHYADDQRIYRFEMKYVFL
jgi:hypothetical protein